MVSKHNYRLDNRRTDFISHQLFISCRTTQALPYLFLCGMLMIIAMILPGISGAFILVLLGAYETALETVELVRSFRMLGFLNLLAFGLGAITGLKLFAHWVGKLYLNYRNLLLATMSGFMFGSLYKVWPWKQYHKRSKIVFKSLFYLTLNTTIPNCGLAFCLYLSGVS